MAKKNEEIVGLVTERFSRAEKSRLQYDAKWDKLYDLYRFQVKKPVPGRSNLFIPYAFSNVETVFPRMVAKTPRISVVPVGPDDVEGSDLMKSLIEYTWEKYDFDETVRRAVKSMLIYGTGAMKIVWKKEIKRYSDLEDELLPDGTLQTTKKGKSKVTYDGPCLLNVDLRDIYPDPNGVTVESCRYIIHKYAATRGELESNPSYKANDIKQITYGYTNDQIKRGISGETRMSLQENEAEVLEYWEDDRLIVLAGGAVLRDEPNPYDHKKKPFVLLTDHIDDQVLYGIGEVEPVEGLQSEMNTLRNQRMDFNNITLNPVWQVRAGSVADLDAIQFKPNYKIVVQGDASAVNPINMPQAPQTSFKEEESIKQDLQTVTGVSDYSRGSEAGGLNDTATGISLIQEAANQRFNAKLQNMEFGLKKIGEFVRDLWLQFADPEMVIRITEKDGYSFLKFMKDDITGEYDIRIESGSTVPSNKLQERNEEMNKYNVLTANPLIQGSPEALLEVTRALLEKWSDPNLEPIMEALGMKVDEVNKQKQMREAEMEDAKLKERAMETAQYIGSKAASRANSMAIDGETPQGEPEPSQILPGEGGEEIPPEFMEMAASMLEKGKGPMKGGEGVIEELAAGMRE